MLVGGQSASSCVIPPSLDADEVDAGQSSSPVILSVSAEIDSDFALPGPLVLERGADERLFLTVHDNDIDDDLFVRLFVNYPDDVAVRADCQGAPSGEIERDIECPARNLCDGIDDQDGSRQFLEAMVADRPFLPDNHEDAEGQDVNRALPHGAGFSFRAWWIICTETD